MQQLTDLLRELSAIHAVSGYEDDMIQFMYQRMAEFADEVSVDNMGSVIAIRHGQNSHGRRVMFFAHMDEVGFMVRKREAAGYFRLMSVAGNHRVLPGQEVQIRTFGGELVRGVVGVKSAHLTTAVEAETVPGFDSLYVYLVDDGLAATVEVGNTVSFRPGWRTLADGLVSTKALDNRAGCCVLLEALRRLAGQQLDATVAFVGTVQEEISCDGALGPAQAFGAELGITVDGTVCYDSPDTLPDGDVRCGGGPVITRLLRTPGLNGWTPHPKLALFIEKTAQELDVPFQRDAVYGLMSDAKPLRLAGIPSALIGIPMRGKHSSAEVISLQDVEQSIELVIELARRIDSTLDLSRVR